MSQLSHLIIELPNKFRKSSELRNYMNEILKELEYDNKNCYSYAAKVISIVCQDLQKHQEESKDYLEICTNFMIEIYKFTNAEKYEKFILQNLKFFVYFLLNKNAEKQLDTYLEKFVIKKIYCTDSYRFYFDIVKNVQFYLLQKHTQSQLEIVDFKNAESCFQNLAKCINVPDENQFLIFFKELFNHESSFNAMYKHNNHAKNLMNLCLMNLKKISNIKNLDEYFIIITKSFILFNKYEILLESKLTWSIELLKNVVENCLIKKSTYHHYALTLLLYLSTLRNKKCSQSNLKNILRKQLKLFENNQEVDWYFDLQLTLVQFLFRNSNYILDGIEEDNLKIIIEILYKITRNILKSTYLKENCSNCKQYKIHDFINLFQIYVDVYEQIVKFNWDAEIIKILIENILEHIKQNLFHISQCKYMNVIFKNKCSFLKKIISKINSAKMAKLAVDIVNSLNYDIQESQEKLVFIKLYLNLYIILDEKNLILQLYAAMLQLLPSKDNDGISSCMFSFVKQLIELNMTDTTIKEVLQSCNKKFIYKQHNDENIKFLTKKQLEIIIIYKLFSVDKIEYLFEKLMDENCLTTLEFIMIARSFEHLIKSKKVRQKISDTKILIEKDNNNCEKYLILGHLYKYEALTKFEASKNTFNSKITTEDNLMDINISNFNKISLEKECEIVKPAIVSLNNFNSVYKFYGATNNDLINSNAILDDLSYLARNFHLRGYLDFAIKAWFLVFKFAGDNSENELYKMRAISYFCKYVHCGLLEKYDLHLEKEINSLSEKILDQYNNLENLSPRKQNYVLLCLLNVAYNYSYENDIESFNSLVKMVQVKINKIEERKNKFDLVRAHLSALEFNFRTKHFAKLTVSPYMFISHILNELKQIVYITSEDSLNMSCFLIEFLEDIASYLFAMLDTKMIISYITYVLSFSLQYGITLRITKLFTTWTKINLQNGDLFNTQLKLWILEKLLFQTNFETVSIDKYFNEAIKSKKVEDNIQINLSAPVEEARKAIKNISLSEDCLLFPKYFQHKNFQKYLIEHHDQCTCNFCKFPIYKFIIFDIGCCYLQMNILKDNNTFDTQLFIEAALKWWSITDEAQMKILFEETLFYLYLDYIKCLRTNGLYQEAVDFCDTTSKLIENNKKFHNNMIWKVMEHYFAIQSNSKVDEIIIIDSPTLKTKQRGRPRKVEI